MTKIYLSIVYVILNIVVLLGFVAPYMISAQSDIMVILGVALILADGLHLGLFVTKVVKNVLNFVKLNKNKNETK